MKPAYEKGANEAVITSSDRLFRASPEQLSVSLYQITTFKSRFFTNNNSKSLIRVIGETVFLSCLIIGGQGTLA